MSRQDCVTHRPVLHPLFPMEGLKKTQKRLIRHPSPCVRCVPLANTLCQAGISERVSRVSQKGAVRGGGGIPEERGRSLKKQEICFKIYHKVELLSRGPWALLQPPCGAAQIPWMQIGAGLGLTAGNSSLCPLAGKHQDAAVQMHLPAENAPPVIMLWGREDLS